jgi:hypothetical protein
VCRVCRHQTSITAGTILEKTRTPLTTWFDAAWHVTTAKNGFSAKTLERTLGTGYRVAWTILHRFRIAMVRSEREQLSGGVEVDETLIGGVEHGGKTGRGAKKCIVAIAVEVKQPKGFGRVRMRHIPDASDFSADLVAILLTARMLSGFTARQSTCRAACRVSVRYHPSHATQGPSESLLPIPTQRFFARMTPDRPLIFASRTSDPGQTPLEFLSLDGSGTN